MCCGFGSDFEGFWCFVAWNHWESLQKSPDISKIKNIVIRRIQYVFVMCLLRGTRYTSTRLRLGGLCTKSYPTLTSLPMNMFLSESKWRNSKVFKRESMDLLQNWWASSYLPSLEHIKNPPGRSASFSRNLVRSVAGSLDAKGDDTNWNTIIWVIRTLILKKWAIEYH